MEIEWKILPRGDVAPHWSGFYISLNRRGAIAMSRVTHERLGAPEAVLIMYDPPNALLALKAAKPGERNAYPVRANGRRGGRVVRAYRLITDFGIAPKDTIEFKDAKLDPEGQLILDLQKIRISPKAHSQCRSRTSVRK